MEQLGVVATEVSEAESETDPPARLVVFGILRTARKSLGGAKSREAHEIAMLGMMKTSLLAFALCVSSPIAL